MYQEHLDDTIGVIIIGTSKDIEHIGQKKKGQTTINKT